MAERRAGAGIAALASIAALLIGPGSAAAAPCELPGPEDKTLQRSLTISGELPSSLEGGFVYLPFRVPAGTTAVRARYCHDQPDLELPGQVPNRPRHVLDLGLYEPARGSRLWGMQQLRGWGGSSTRDVTVSPNGFTPDTVYEADRRAHVTGYTTRAYQPGPIPGGRWAVELGVAAVATQAEGDADGMVEFSVGIELSRKRVWSRRPYEPVRYDRSPAIDRPGWYSGDFHVHGEHEPGNATMRQTFDYAFAPYGGLGAGLDFVTLVDHNNTVAFGEIGRYQDDYPRKLIARSTEVTTYRGHLQNHVSGDTVDYRTGPLYVGELQGSGATRTLAAIEEGQPARPPRAASSIFRRIRRGGGFTQINHPTIFPSEVPTFDDFCRGCPWDYTGTETDYSLVDAIEIATGPAGLNVVTQPGPNPFTLLALGFYESAIDAGGLNANHIAVVGSSDSHQAIARADLDPIANLTDAPIGMATTVVRAPELSESGIRRGVQEGHTYVKMWGADGPDLRMRAVGADGAPKIIGDTVSGGTAHFTARVLNLDEATAARPGLYFLVVMRDGELFSLNPIPSGQDEFSIDFESQGPGRYELRVQRLLVGAASFEAASTPIWVEP